MAEFLFTIQETFELKVVGLMVAVDIKLKDAKLNIGDEIKLRLANDSQIITKIESIPLLSPYDPERLFSFSLPKNLTKADVPIGTEVWSHP